MPEFKPDPRGLPARRKLAGHLTDLDNLNLIRLKEELREKESVFPPKLPESARGFQHVANMYPSPPKVEILPGSYNDPGATALYQGSENTAKLHKDSPPSTTAHEFEHAAQYGVYPSHNNPIDFIDYAMKDMNNVSPGGKKVSFFGNDDNLSKELPATVLGRVFPYAERTSMASNPATAARQIPPDGQDTKANFPGGYSPQMSWMNEQMHRHGVYGQTPLAKSLGFQGQAPVPITHSIANNPQWVGTIAGQDLPGKPQNNNPYNKLRNTRPPAGPDLRGLLP